MTKRVHSKVFKVQGSAFPKQGSGFRVQAFLLAALLAMAIPCAAAVPPPEKLLPSDTLLMITAPDFAKLSEIFKKSPQSQFWNDPAMKAYKDNFTTKWEEDFVKPLERDLGIKFEDYTGLLQGQVTVAVTESGWQGKEDQAPGMLLLVDAKDKGAQLKKNLSELRKKCADAGKTVRTEKVRDVEFLVISLSTNDVPPTLRKFFPQHARSRDGAEASEPAKSAQKQEVVLGQVDSVLVLANTVKAVEPIVARLTGGGAPPLGEVPSYQANHLSMFRDSPLYAWINVKSFLDITLRAAAAEKSESSSTPGPEMKPEKIVGALGLSALKSIALSYQDSNEGALFQVFLSVPESGRQGIFKILAPEPKESGPPPFVPATAINFQRWRWDGQKAFATLERTLNDLSPEAVSGLKWLLDTATKAGQEKDPGFDVKKNLIGNLGDDIISYEKAPPTDAAAGTSAPSVSLIGSPHADQLCAALKATLGALAIFNPQAGSPKEREFLGHKIYSSPMPPLPMMPMMAAPAAKSLHYAAGGSYVALSTDPAMVEEYLRSSDSQAKALRETSGLLEASQKIGGMATGLFGYINGAETGRISYEGRKKSSSSSSKSDSVNPMSAALPWLDVMKTIKPWFDDSLLPSYDKVSKYMYFRVYSGSATVDGLSFKLFVPTPPALRK